jgi:hypothetical protein
VPKVGFEPDFRPFKHRKVASSWGFPAQSGSVEASPEANVFPAGTAGIRVTSSSGTRELCQQLGIVISDELKAIGDFLAAFSTRLRIPVIVSWQENPSKGLFRLFALTIFGAVMLRDFSDHA